MTKRICIIGAGPSGLAQLRAFQSATGKARKFLRSFVTRNRRIGVGSGGIPGAPGWTSTAIPVTGRCTLSLVEWA